MRILPRRTSRTKESLHEEDTTKEFAAGAEGRVVRRIEVTVERETLSIVVRRPAGPKAEDAGK